MIDLLALLKRLETDVLTDACPECFGLKVKGHRAGCELKAAIDGLQSGRLEIIDKDAAIEGLTASSVVTSARQILANQATMNASIARQIEDGGHGLRS